MPRFVTLLALVCFVPVAIAAEPSSVEKQIAIQHAMAAAEQFLKDNMPAQAAQALEEVLSRADGNKAYLALLKRAYLAELTLLMNDPATNAKRLSQVHRNLDILVGGQPATTSSSTSPTTPVAAPNLTDAPLLASANDGAADIGDAASAFKKGDYAQAEKIFASLGEVKLNPDQKAAWACCRIRIAAAKVNAIQCDTATASAAAQDVAAAIKLAPQNSELQKIGQQVIAVANLKAICRDGTVPCPAPAVDLTVKPVVAEGNDELVTASFRVHYSGSRELAERVARAAENCRKTISERWSGPLSGTWEPKCEIVIHPNAEAYARSTNRPASSTGTATVRLVDSRASERRIDLRADDIDIVANALPREMTHIVLADLFPDKPPPRWAEEGMAVLSGTAEEAGRYTSTLRRCARNGEWYGLAQLMEMKDFPGEKITGFYCESVSLTEYLVRARGEKNFTIFLRDSQRYGLAQALKRQYGIDNPQALEAVWKRTALEIGRGQAP